MKFAGSAEYVAPTDLIVAAEDLAPGDLRGDAASALPRMHGGLLKTEQDVQLFDRLAFLARGCRS